LRTIKPGKNPEKGKKYAEQLAEQLRAIHGVYKPETFTPNPMSEGVKKRQWHLRNANWNSKQKNMDRIRKGK
jgi:hypothetical protein